MKKSISFITLMFLMLSLLVGCDVASNELDPASPNPVSDFEYEVNKDGGVTITKYVGTDKSVVIPSKIDEKDVTIIGLGAFRETKIVSVFVPTTVKTLFNTSFAHCEKLEKVVLSEGLEQIYSGAFSECSALSEVNIPSSVWLLDTNVFKECKSLKAISIPGGIKSIGESAFSFSGLEQVVFEEGIEYIGYFAFVGTNLKEITLPDSVLGIEYGAFSSCAQLESVTLSKNLVYFENSVFSGNTALKKIVIPAGIERINQTIFKGCTALEAVYFEGNAPEKYIMDSENYPNQNYNYTIFYREGAEGFTSPKWCGYQTEIWE